MRKAMLAIVLIGAVAVVVIGIVALSRSRKLPSVETPPAPSVRQVRAPIYFVDLSQRIIVSHPALVPDPSVNLQVAVQTVIERMMTPPSPSLTSVVPEGVKVLEASMKDDVLTVNFSQGFTDAQHWAGSEVAYLRLQALVHSLTTLTGARRLRILVNGSTPEPLGGHEDVSEPVEPDASVITRQE